STKNMRRSFSLFLEFIQLATATKEGAIEETENIILARSEISGVACKPVILRRIFASGSILSPRI
ncbi:unnamed protein product, partial [Thlaspi arvense]